MNNLPIEAAAAVLIAAAAIVLVCGVRLTRVADRFAVATGIGGAVTGAAVLGALTSLPGSIRR